MTDQLSILAFSGSLRSGSLNTVVLTELGRLAPEGVSVEIADYRALPLFDSDLGVVPEVERLRGQVAAAQAVLIATPEYNYSVPGGLKNALDWLSRPAYQSVFAGKPVGVLSVSPGPIGGARAQAHLKAILGGMVAHVYPSPELAIGLGNERIQEGRVVAAATQDLLESYIAGFSSWVRREARAAVSD